MTGRRTEVRTVEPGAGAGASRRTPRALLGLALTAVLALAGVAVPQEEASAAVGVTLEGRGYGHGRGMSQHGARGRADAGQTYRQIVATYYPGTTLTTGSDSTPIRVWIQGDTDSQTWVRTEPGLSVRTNGSSIALPTSLGGQAPTLWRIRLVSATLVVEGYAGGVWQTHGDPAITAALANQPTATFVAPDSTVELVFTTYREYRGTVGATRVGTGSTAVVRTVVTSTMGNYLRSVVPSEMPALWPADALRSQSVAARTYAAFDRDVDRNATWYDTCDTTSCQVYKGVADRRSSGAIITTHENPLTDAAVAATAGQILTYGGQPAFTQFSASNGGYALAGSQPYLTAFADPYDQYPTWTASLSGTTISAAYPAIGSFTGLAVTGRDGKGAYGGRVTGVRITGTAGSVTVTGDQFRTAFGLRSTLWNPTAVITPVVAPQRDWTGDGGPDLIGRAPDGKLYVYPGLPGASFARRYQIGKGWNTMRLMTQVHDFSGTRVPELITTNPEGLLYLYPGDGRGGFGVPKRLGQGWWGFDLLVGVDGWHAAGAPGLLARKASTGQLLLYPGDGRGGFGAVRDLGTGWNTYDMLLAGGDWDGDGKADLMGRVAADGDLVLFRGDGRGGVASSARIGNGWGGMDEIVGAADWDRDGFYDLIARVDGTGELWLYPGDGGGGFLPRRQIGFGWVGFSLAK